jgi:hypothetical protein
LTGGPAGPILSGMPWFALWKRCGFVEAVPALPEPETEEELRLFPIVGADLCYPVAALLARGQLEEAARLVSDRAWVASTPLYG